jgi:S-adenosylmethionine synthetase
MTVFKVLITGASGLLGRAVYKYFTDESFREKYPVSTEIRFHFDCLGLCYSRAKNNLRAADLNDFEQVDQLVDEFKVNRIVTAKYLAKENNIYSFF